MPLSPTLWGSGELLDPYSRFGDDKQHTQDREVGPDSDAMVTNPTCSMSSETGQNRRELSSVLKNRCSILRHLLSYFSWGFIDSLIEVPVLRRSHSQDIEF
jgi:hypothetical protein